MISLFCRHSQAHSKVVETVLNSSNLKETIGRKTPVAAIGSFSVCSESVQPIQNIGCGGRI